MEAIRSSRPSIVVVFVITAVASSCSSSGAAGGVTTEAAPVDVFTFEEALAADSATFEPPTAFKAVAEGDWAEAALTGTIAGPRVDDSKWRLSETCTVHFTTESDILATSEGAPLPTKKLAGEACHGRTGYWQISAGRVYWWMPLAGGWSVEYYGDFADDSTMYIRRYALSRTGDRSWRADRDAMASGRASRLIEVRAVRATYEVVRNLRAVSETDWATRPGAGTAPNLGGSQWRMANGCVLSFDAEVLARGTNTQRLTRALGSTECDGLRGSWQQVGRRVFWLVNLDSLTAVETYAEVSDTLMRARHFDLTRATPSAAFNGVWNPTKSHVLVRVKR